MNQRSEKVNQTFDIFKTTFGSAVRPTYISEIINGENIATKDANISIDEPIDPEYSIDPTKFEQQLSLCNKKLFNYQKKAILKLRELELKGYRDIGSHRLVSNAWLLSLPIGSGKSLVFQFLSVFFSKHVPCHPIILSLDGSNIPNYNIPEIKEHPYFYECCSYVMKKPVKSPSLESLSEAYLLDNTSISMYEPACVVTLKNYTQRNTTVILTHSHLLDQIRQYFEDDFSRILNQLNIEYIESYHQMRQSLDKVNILVVSAKQSNVDWLVNLSLEQPFMRVIVDDYTSMTCVENYRQIRASSTIFVSGTGFERNPEEIPTSYYTLRNAPVDWLTVVGNPNETYVGVLRDSIATMELMGSSCKFSSYKFISELEELCSVTFKKPIFEVYPILKERPVLFNYLNLAFIIRNFDRLSSVIQLVEKHIAMNRLQPEKVKYYLEWKNTNQFLIERLLSNTNAGSTTAPIVSDPICMNCGKEAHQHLAFGVLASCCGAFYCSHCLDSCCSNIITNTKDNIQTNDSYCSCCRKKSPKHIMNIPRRNDSNITLTSNLKDYFDSSQFSNSIEFDMYFYQFLHGFTAVKNNGRPINILNDIQQGTLHENDLKNITNKPIEIETILPQDHIYMLTLQMINQTLQQLHVRPRNNSTIIFYGCPTHLVDRLKYYFKALTSNAMEIITIKNPRNQQERQLRQQQVDQVIEMCPVANCNVLFKNNMSDLIGLHANIIALVSCDNNEYGTKRKVSDITLQKFGRILRLNNYASELSIYANVTSNEYE